MHLSRIQQIIILTITAIVIVLFLNIIIYKYTGWKSFSMKKGENFQILDVDPTLVKNIKFSDCVFYIKGKAGMTKQYTVTYVLNKMVAAYENNTNKNYIFKLDDPGLSVYSFQIPGFNDKDNHPNTLIWNDQDKDTIITLTGYYKLLN